jgi:DNA helicase-2/ATP-dependent DNA helicase PcrA
VLKQHFPVAVEHRRQLAKLFSSYVAAKTDQNVLDFDDLLVYWDLLLTDDGMARTIGGQFDHILVDEYQDTNILQASILRRMKPDGAGVTVVGDDAQSIYRFRAAEVRNILEFDKQFTKPATTVKLVRNYRSTAPILAASNAVINLATEGFTKSLKTRRKGGSKPCLITVNDDHAQAQYVANEIATQHAEGRDLKHMAVLYRSNHHSMMLQAELARCGIAFKVFGGAKFTEAKHIKDVLAVLKWAENPSDRISAFRVLNLLPGIGGVTAKRVLDAVVTASGPVAALTAFAPPPRARANWPAFVELMDRLHETKSLWPGEFDAVLRWYRPLLEEIMDDFANRWADLQQLQVIAGTYKSRRKLLTDLTLDPPSKQKKPDLNKVDDDVLTLSTIHSGKGREWHTVYVLSVVEGCLPSSKAKSAAEREEERRLLYVAMTRAKRNLTLIVPWRYAQFGQWNDSATVPRSSFIPDEILGHFEERAWRLGDDDDDNDDTRFDAGGQPPFDLMDRAQQLWI